MTQTPSQFSSYNARLQIAWDSTSIGSLMQCPRYYQLTILEGWGGSSVHTEFGGYFASAVEHYKKLRLEGRSKDDAQLRATASLLESTWDERDATDGGGPWGGRYEEQWRCTGTEPYKNNKGNRAKCPWSHKGAWFPAPGPDICGECGSGTDTERQWVAADTVKNRITLVRTFLGYTDAQPATEMDGGIQPFAFPDGTPAVELSFAIPSPWVNKYAEPIILAGHLDSIGTFGREHYITDNKTTKNYLGEKFWQGFSPNVQVDFYDLIGSILYPALNLQGVIIEGAQVAAARVSYGLRPFRKTDAQREEYLGEIHWWLIQAEQMAEAGYWPMNRKSCYLCPFKEVCGADPSERQQILEQKFKKRDKLWNPLSQR